MIYLVARHEYALDAKSWCTVPGSVKKMTGKTFTVKNAGSLVKSSIGVRSLIGLARITPLSLPPLSFKPR